MEHGQVKLLCYCQEWENGIVLVRMGLLGIMEMGGERNGVGCLRENETVMVENKSCREYEKVGVVNGMGDTVVINLYTFFFSFLMI